MAIDDLTAVLAPPDHVRPFTQDSWLQVERKIGTKLPADYKAYADLYGLGRLSSFIVVFVPTIEILNCDLLIQIERKLGALRELRDGFGEPCPYPLFPEPGGLLPFAGTDNGDVLHWSTAGPPDEWPVVVNDSRSPLYEKHECNMTSFLAELLSGRRRCTIFPDIGGAPSFEPI